MSKKETQYNWFEMCYKIDPELSAPVKQYVFDNGNKIFYKPKKRNKYGTRTSGNKNRS